jgi:hypothetical protein
MVPAAKNKIRPLRMGLINSSSPEYVERKRQFCQVVRLAATAMYGIILGIPV